MSLQRDIKAERSTKTHYEKSIYCHDSFASRRVQYKSPQDSLKMNEGRKEGGKNHSCEKHFVQHNRCCSCISLKEGEKKNSYKKLQIPKMQGHRE